MDNNEEVLSDGSSPSTDEETGFMLASSYPKRQAGRRKFKETRHPVYRGIRERNSGKWVSEIRHPNNNKTRIWLGTYPTAEMAARAHDVAVIALRGRHGACLNFADSVWRLPVPVSADTKDIQKAAAEAAEVFRPMAEAPTLPPHAVAEKAAEEEESAVFYMDEDVEFGMPGLMTDMYQGLLMLPPVIDTWNYYGYNNDDVECEGADVSLWSFSV